VKRFLICLVPSLIILTGCDTRENALAMAQRELDAYCKRERADCSSAKLVAVNSEWFGWSLDYVISEKPEHLVSMEVGPFGSFEMSRMKEE